VRDFILKVEVVFVTPFLFRDLHGGLKARLRTCRMLSEWTVSLEREEGASAQCSVMASRGMFIPMLQLH
jgi:hypothetical protein